MAKENRKCFLCGKGYHYCPNCAADRDKPSWYNMFCSEECHELNDILCANNFKRLSDEDACEKIKNIKVPRIAIEENRKKIEELLSVRKKAAKKVKPEPHISE